MPKVIAQKPEKPYPEFPLFPHATKRWAKKIRGKLHYFGPWDSPEAALNKYLDERDALHAGRKPREVTPAGVTTRDLCNRFLTSKQLLCDSGELAPRSFADYHATCERVLLTFGKDRLVEDLASDDFDALRASIARIWGPVRLGNEIQRIRSVFKYAYDSGLIERPIRFGPHFKRPSNKVLRHARHAKGQRMFEAADLKRLIAEATLPLKAMLLLGINAGFGNNDCASLPIPAVDFRRGWINFPRPKTGIMRRVPLWQETQKALKLVLENRPQPKRDEAENLVFVTKYGQPWGKAVADSPITKETRKLLDELKLYRPGLSFYALRHTFETVGGENGDQIAVDTLMGHAPASNDMSAAYREKVSDERLKRVTDFVHAWLFARTKSAKRKAK